MQTLQQQQTRAASRPAALAKPALLGMRVALSRPAFGATLVQVWEFFLAALAARKQQRAKMAPHRGQKNTRGTSGVTARQEHHLHGSLA